MNSSAERTLFSDATINSLLSTNRSAGGVLFGVEIVKTPQSEI
jgi:hypothetical protein